MKVRLNLPNQITVARLGLAIVFFIMLSQYEHGVTSLSLLDAAIVVFVIAASTDFLDGYLARKYGQVTALGRILDPLVDKVLICGAFILLLSPGFIDANGHNVTELRGWMVVVIVGRELLVTGLRGFNESIGKSFGASLHGKLKMWMQSIAAPTVLLIVAHEEAWNLGAIGGQIKSVLMWMTVVITALSTIQYLIRSRHILDESSGA